MVKHQQSGSPGEWLQQISKERGDHTASLKAAIDLYDSSQITLLEKGIRIADILFHMGLDNETLAAAIIYPGLQANEFHLDLITDHFGVSYGKLLRDALQMQSLSKFQNLAARKSHQVENLRKMLLAMITDVRAVLITLAERLWQLRNAKILTTEDQQRLAQETLDVYAPLANRLGVWQLKWEIEDLCMRYLQPDAYMAIAKWLASKRVEREENIERMIATITEMLQQSQVKSFSIHGRVKHIYSIHRKMERKQCPIEEIFDVSAVRVLVDNTADCYTVLSELHNAWEHIPDEFDDYIVKPKINGYRSIHTVIIGPENRTLEIQIRTHEMHETSELGVASHWRYKEGILQTSDYEAKIALLRQIMAWQKEVATTEPASPAMPMQDLFADRIYVFTPTGDIVDLPKSATPLDFAYHIHSEVGHRCRGAKVDNKIVPLTYHLQTGQRIEILTAKQPNPSRDWLNPHLGYLTTQRARAKLQHWFKEIDSSYHVSAGREILDKELKRIGYNEKLNLENIAAKLNYKSADGMLAALGSSDIHVPQIINYLRPNTQQVQITHPIREVDALPETGGKVSGINNLLTKVARCCKPLPGDAVIGYITQARGVSIHRRDCTNITNVKDHNKPRFIEVDWDNRFTGAYAVDIQLKTHYHSALFRDITALLTTEKFHVLGLQIMPGAQGSVTNINLTVEISTVLQLNKVINLLHQLPNVLEVHRR